MRSARGSPTTPGDPGRRPSRLCPAPLLSLEWTAPERDHPPALRGLTLRHDGSIVLETRVTGGTYRSTGIADPAVKPALFDYVRVRNRLDDLTKQSPLWIATDRAKTTLPGQAKHNPRNDKTRRVPGQPLTAHSVARSLKDYARATGLNHSHVHQTRHTFALFWLPASSA